MRKGLKTDVWEGVTGAYGLLVIFYALFAGVTLTLLGLSLTTAWSFILTMAVTTVIPLILAINLIYMKKETDWFAVLCVIAGVLLIVNTMLPLYTTILTPVAIALLLIGSIGLVAEAFDYIKVFGG